MHHESGEMGCPTCGCGMRGGMGAGMKRIFMMMPWKIMMHADELGINEGQVEQLRKRHAEARKEMIQIMSQIKMTMIDVHSAIMRDQIDMATAEAKAREVAKLKGDKFVAMIKAMNDMRNIFTPEQQQRIRKMVMMWFKKGGMHGMNMGTEAEEEESED